MKAVAIMSIVDAMVSVQSMEHFGMSWRKAQESEPLSDESSVMAACACSFSFLFSLTFLFLFCHFPPIWDLVHVSSPFLPALLNGVSKLLIICALSG